MCLVNFEKTKDEINEILQTTLLKSMRAVRVSAWCEDLVEGM